MSFSKVLLPLPFWPRMPTDSPGKISRLTSFTAHSDCFLELGLLACWFVENRDRSSSNIELGDSATNSKRLLMFSILMIGFESDTGCVFIIKLLYGGHQTSGGKLSLSSLVLTRSGRFPTEPYKSHGLETSDSVRS